MADQGKPQGTLTTSQLKTIKIVAIDSTALDPKDKEILCSAICYCNYNPNKGKTQNNLYQSCVSERLKEMDEMMYKIGLGMEVSSLNPFIKAYYEKMNLDELNEAEINVLGSIENSRKLVDSCKENLKKKTKGN